MVIGTDRSAPQCLKYGVPQGSVLGPVMYTIYTVPLSDQVLSQSVLHHFYADDSQLYNVFRSTPADVQRCVSHMETCVESVKVWMSANKLKLNDDKTEIITFAARTRPLEKLSLHVGDTTISSVPCVRDLGVLLDESLTMENQVLQVCKSAYFQLRKIASIRRYLTSAATRSLVHALVTSRLDYCNSLLVGLPGSLLQKLQKVQNTAARIITRTARYEHITPVLMELHWLPIKRRVEFKVLLYTFKAIHGDAPAYMKDMVQIKTPQRSL